VEQHQSILTTHFGSLFRARSATSPVTLRSTRCYFTAMLPENSLESAQRWTDCSKQRSFKMPKLPEPSYRPHDQSPRKPRRMVDLDVRPIIKHKSLRSLDEILDQDSSTRGSVPSKPTRQRSRSEVVRNVMYFEGVVPAAIDIPLDFQHHRRIA